MACAQRCRVYRGSALVLSYVMSSTMALKVGLPGPSLNDDSTIPCGYSAFLPLGGIEGVAKALVTDTTLPLMLVFPTFFPTYEARFPASPTGRVSACSECKKPSPRPLSPSGKWQWLGKSVSLRWSH